MRKLYFLLFCLSIASVAFPQCKNSISLLKTTTTENGSGKTGVVEVSVTSSDEYICTLSIEKGSGPQKVAEKKGKGTAVIEFEGLDVNHIYQVQLEFLSDNSPCRKLQKSPIIFQVE